MRVWVLEVDTCGYEGISWIDSVHETKESAVKYIEKHWKFLSSYKDSDDEYSVFGYGGNVYLHHSGIIYEKNRDNEQDTDDSCDYEADSVCLKVKSFNLVKEKQ